MGIAMTFARVSGPGDLRTRRRGPRGDDGIPGRERHRGHDARRRSRDVGKLRRKSRTTVYRNVEMVFPFVFGKLRDIHMNLKTGIIKRLISMISYMAMFAIMAHVWYFLLLDPWLAILGLTDQIENYDQWQRNLIELAPFVPLAIIIAVIHEKVVVKKLYRDEK